MSLCMVWAQHEQTGNDDETFFKIGLLFPPRFRDLKGWQSPSQLPLKVLYFNLVAGSRCSCGDVNTAGMEAFEGSREDSCIIDF